MPPYGNCNIYLFGSMALDTLSATFRRGPALRFIILKPQFKFEIRYG